MKKNDALTSCTSKRHVPRLISARLSDLAGDMQHSSKAEHSLTGWHLAYKLYLIVAYRCHDAVEELMPLFFRKLSSRRDQLARRELARVRQVACDHLKQQHAKAPNFPCCRVACSPGPSNASTKLADQFFACRTRKAASLLQPRTPCMHAAMRLVREWGCPTSGSSQVNEQAS